MMATVDSEKGAAVVAAGSLTLVLPDVDIWVRAFSRHHPDPLVVHAFGVVVAERRVVLAGAVAQQVLARLRDDAAAARMEALLDAFPLVRAVAADHRRAAALMRMRPAAGAPHAGVPGAAAALLWAQAERVGGVGEVGVPCDLIFWHILVFCCLSNRARSRSGPPLICLERPSRLINGRGDGVEAKKDLKKRLPTQVDRQPPG